MNTKAKDYIEQCLENPVDADKIGFLLIENFEKVPYTKWPFLGGDVYVAEFNREKCVIEKIDGKSPEGETNPERLKRFIEKYNPNSRIHSSYQLLWTCEQLSRRLLIDEKSPEVFDLCKRLSKETFTQTELADLCKRVNDFNQRQYQEANDRATLISRAN